MNDLDGVLEKFDQILGLPLLRAVHLNDSMTPFASHKDRHAAIGKGTIGLEALLRVMEPPNDDQGHADEIRMLNLSLKNRKKN